MVGKSYFALNFYSFRNIEHLKTLNPPKKKQKQNNNNKPSPIFL